MRLQPHRCLLGALVAWGALLAPVSCVSASCDSAAVGGSCSANSPAPAAAAGGAAVDPALFAQLASTLSQLAQTNADLLAKFHTLEAKVAEVTHSAVTEANARGPPAGQADQRREAPAAPPAPADPYTQPLVIPPTPAPTSDVVPTPPTPLPPSILIERVSNPNFRLTEEESTALHRSRGGLPQEQANLTEMESAQQASRALLDWLQAYNVDSGDLPMGIAHAGQCARKGDCRGVYAVRNITAGSHVLHVPRALLLDAAVAFASPWTQLRETYQPESESFWMAIFLLYDYMRPAAFQNGVPFDYGAPSPWTRFYSVLPSDFPTLPIFFDLAPASAPGDDWNIWLRASPTLNQIKTSVKEMEIEYNDACRVLATQAFGQLFTKAQYFWARAVLTTRAFGMDAPNPRANQTNQRARVTTSLVPGADMLNHAVQERLATTWEYNSTSLQFEMRAVQNISAGAEVTTTYGSRSNSHLFVQYGFVLDQNPFNEAVVSMRVPLELSVRRGRTGSRDADAGAVGEGIQPIGPALFGATLEERLTFKAQKLKILKLTHPGLALWSSTIDLNYVHPPYATQEEAAQWDVYRCTFTAEGKSGYFSTCHSFARYAVATPTELLSIFTGSLPACGPMSGTQEPISYAHELRAIQYLAGAATEQHAQYELAVEEESAFLKQHEAAVQAGFCDAHLQDKIDAGARQQAGCLTQNQLNMLKVRQGEKELLQMQVSIGAAVRAFAERPLMTKAEVAHYLTERFPSGEARRQGPFLYLQHILLPLYAKHARWREQEAEAEAHAQALAHANRQAQAAAQTQADQVAVA